MTVQKLAKNGLLMGLSLFMIVALENVLFFMDFTTNELSIIRMLLLIPLAYGFVMVVDALL